MKRHPRSYPRTDLPFLFKMHRSGPLFPTTQPLLYDTKTKTCLHRDANCMIFADAFPKSAVHCLVVPVDRALHSLNDLTAEHVALLDAMSSAAQKYSRFLKQASPKFARLKFIEGYHSLPSLPLLHLHLISLDLDSECMNTRKHYNTFATNFFLPGDAVRRDLHLHGRVTINQDVEHLEELEKAPLTCLWCGEPFQQMPKLKQHLSTCSNNLALDPR